MRNDQNFVPEKVTVFCRSGFEADAGQELSEQSAALGMSGYFQPASGQGFLNFIFSGLGSPEQLLQQVPIESLVFARDWMVQVAEVELPKQDRVGAILEALKDSCEALPTADRVEIRTPVNNADEDLGRFARKLASPLSRSLKKHGFLTSSSHPSSGRLEVFLPSFDTAIVGYSRPENRARWLGGIPRLKLPPEAPSRSALKLEEAWKFFIPSSLWLDYLGGGKTAADLGAAPGGWTWQLVQQGMTVFAIDNGPMNDALMASGMVTHVREDGYLWEPKRPLDWMVCDIVDKPRRTAELVSRWLSQGLCRYTVFNLKLPMKKRYAEWVVCRDRIVEALAQTDRDFRIQARHLYHDREEITCFVERLD